jgi:hypothetical protein
MNVNGAHVANGWVGGLGEVHGISTHKPAYMPMAKTCQQLRNSITRYSKSNYQLHKMVPGWLFTAFGY